MLRRLALATILMTGLVATAQGQDLELALSDEMAELIFANTMEQGERQSVGYGGGVLYNDARDLMGHLFLLVENQARGDWQPLRFGIGGKIVGADIERRDETIAALAVGGRVGVGIPADIPLEVVAQGFISPNITTSGDADRYTEMHLRLEAELVRGAKVFAGYRQIKFHLDSMRDARVDDGLHAGLRLSF